MTRTPTTACHTTLTAMITPSLTTAPPPPPPSQQQYPHWCHHHMRMTTSPPTWATTQPSPETTTHWGLAEAPEGCLHLFHPQNSPWLCCLDNPAFPLWQMGGWTPGRLQLPRKLGIDWPHLQMSACCPKELSHVKKSNMWFLFSVNAMARKSYTVTVYCQFEERSTILYFHTQCKTVTERQV